MYPTIRATVLGSLVLSLLSGGTAQAQWSSTGAPVSIGRAWSTNFIAYYPVLLPDDSGGAVVAWSDFSAVYVQRITGAGSIAPGWSPDGQFVTTAPHGPGDEVFPAIASDGAGGVIVVWHDRRRTAQTIYAQRISAAGARVWPDTGLAVCRPAVPSQVSAPYATSDGAGGVIVAWDDNRTGIWKPYAIRIDGSGSVAPGWTPDGSSVSSATSNASVSSVVEDGDGGAYVVWTDDRDAPASDLYAQHLDGNGNLATGSVPGGTLFCTATGSRRAALGVADGSGGALFAWPDQRNLIDTDVYAQRLDSAGSLAFGWTIAGFVVSATAGNQSDIANTPSRLGLVSDGAGGAIIAWQDDRNGPYDIYASRVTDAGVQAPGWIANGTPVCTAAAAQWYPLITPDGLGGAFVAWFDRRNGTDYDVYATHLTAMGAVAPGWPVDGKPVFASSGDQFQGAITADGSGGAVIVWHDTRRGDSEHPDLYAARIRADGAVPALPSLLHAEAQSDRVTVTWYASGEELIAIQRSTDGTDWTTMPATGTMRDGWIVYEDRDVVPGGRYGYRLALGASVSQEFAGETWVDVPQFALALAGATSNPARGDLAVNFTLPDGGAAHIELISASGRIVISCDLAGFGGGAHRLALARGRSVPRGLYFLRLIRKGEERVRRVVYLPD